MYVNIWIDTNFADIHGFMNVALAGAFLSMNLVTANAVHGIAPTRAAFIKP